MQASIVFFPGSETKAAASMDLPNRSKSEKKRLSAMQLATQVRRGAAQVPSLDSKAALVEGASDRLLEHLHREKNKR